MGTGKKRPARRAGAATNKRVVMGAQRTRTRTVRDPIQGDIPLGPLHAAVVDTRIFQRLRYIRQNGLLHFVFPGAVHTRFAHSLGTMSLAAQLARVLFRPSRSVATKPQQRAITYVSTVFELAALLHDVGHCAFSHSIEHVTFEGSPLLGTLRERFEAWGEQELLKEYLSAHGDAADDAVSHEQLGLAFVRRICEDSRVVAACKSVLRVKAADLGRDVRAVMNGALAASPTFATAAQQIELLLQSTVTTIGDAPFDNMQEDLLQILHDLVSGTLDVDRLDYLQRDSFYCGVPYGKCDASILLHNLSLGCVQGRLSLLLAEKAAFALDDMLWSRYQLFVQILNHKTNVGLNKAIGQALEDAIRDDRIRRPSSVEEFIELTDDYVMSRVFSACIHGSLANRSYARALVDRQLPSHLGSEKGGSAKRIASLAQEKASVLGIDPKEIMVAEANSDFIKPGPLPLIVRRDRHTGEMIARSYKSQTSAVPLRHRRVHFFAPRP